MLIENVVKSIRSTVTWKEIDDQTLWTTSGLFGRKAQTGQFVTHDRAMGLPVYWACGRNIAEDLGKCPLVLYRDKPSGDREKATDHPLYDVLRYQFNPNVSAINGKESLLFGALFWHGGFCEIDTDQLTGQVKGLYPIHPSRVRMIEGGNDGIMWEIMSDDINRERYAVPDADMFHVHGIGPNGQQGYSLLEVGLEAIGRGMAIQSFSSNFYRNGTHLSGALKHPGRLKPEERAVLREEWKGLYQGVANHHQVAILQEGMEFASMGMPLDQAQFIETEKMTDLQICQLCRMPPEKVGFRERAQGWSTLEMLNADYVTDTLLSWDVRIAQEVRRKCLSPAEQKTMFAETDFNMLMRGSAESRGNFYFKLWQMGALSPNEIRHKENMNAIEEGDGYYVPRNYAELGEEPVEQPVQPQAPPAPEEEQPKAVDLSPMIADAADRCARREAKAVNRYAKRGEETFESWKDRFYLEHEGYMFLAFKPVGLVVGVSAEAIRRACEEYCNERKALLASGDSLDERGAALKIENEVGGIINAQFTVSC